MPVSGPFYQTLIDAAQGYCALGWSVVPLLGDASSEKPKAAAVAWEPFQRRRAREDELTAWFARGSAQALGLVTGAVSQLAVLDFDDLDLLKAFERACPDLAATRTVVTRRGKHLYFHLPPTVAARSRKLDGVDLLAGGRYAVAPPSVIDGFAYTVGRGGRPRSLTQADLNRIDAFLEALPRPAIGPVPVIPAPVTAVPMSTPTPDASPRLGSDALRQLYLGQAHPGRRNAALFHATCAARDGGWSYAAAVECLADLHAAQGQQRAEKQTSRYREAVATIRSVYTRPPRLPRLRDSAGLYNSIRERLFQLGQTCVVRVLEGLRLAGFHVGQQVTEHQAVQALAGIVGRRSIRAAFAALSPANSPFFEKISPHPPPQSCAATDIRIVNTTNAFVGFSKRVKSLGRPVSRYQIPSLEALCQQLDVQASGSDPLTLDDLQSARRTRQAAHRELIRRRPGVYPQRWLGARLGLSAVTVWRYDRQTPDLHTAPTYHATPIGWHNLTAIPADDAASSAAFLEDETGKRWPALKGIAKRLLGKGKRLRLLVQSLNYYWFGTGDPPVVGLAIERASEVRGPRPDEPLLTFAQRVERLIRHLTPATPQPAVNRASEPVSERKTTEKVDEKSQIDYANPPQKARKVRRRTYWKPLRQADAEALAQRIYTVVNGLTAAAERKLSLVTARQWVDRYSAASIETALRELQRRGGIQRPAGFVATLLRSQARAAQLAAVLGR